MKSVLAIRAPKPRTILSRAEGDLNLKRRDDGSKEAKSSVATETNLEEKGDLARLWKKEGTFGLAPLWQGGFKEGRASAARSEARQAALGALEQEGHEP